MRLLLAWPWLATTWPRRSVDVAMVGNIGIFLVIAPFSHFLHSNMRVSCCRVTCPFPVFRAKTLLVFALCSNVAILLCVTLEERQALAVVAYRAVG